MAEGLKIAILRLGPKWAHLNAQCREIRRSQDNNICKHAGQELADLPGITNI